MSTNKTIKPPPRELDSLSGLIILFGGLYSTGSWLLFGIVSIFYWAIRWKFLPSSFILGLLAVICSIFIVKGIAHSLRTGSLAVKLLKKGVVTRGTIVKVNFTDAKSSENLLKVMRFLPSTHQAVMPAIGYKDEEIRASVKAILEHHSNDKDVALNYHLRFQAEDGREYVVMNTVTGEYRSKLEDEPEELVLYLRNNPNKAVIFDAIFHAPTLKSDGTFEPVDRKKAVYLILPALVIFGNIVCLLL
ncbi:MAG: hypothetical protein AAFP82_07475 [Bacteroidota bacterium]